jgi:hypothetical protein
VQRRVLRNRGSAGGGSGDPGRGLVRRFINGCHALAAIASMRAPHNLTYLTLFWRRKIRALWKAALPCLSPDSTVRHHRSSTLCTTSPHARLSAAILHFLSFFPLHHFTSCSPFSPPPLLETVAASVCLSEQHGSPFSYILSHHPLLGAGGLGAGPYQWNKEWRPFQRLCFPKAYSYFGTIPQILSLVSLSSHSVPSRRCPLLCFRHLGPLSRPDRARLSLPISPTAVATP